MKIDPLRKKKVWSKNYKVPYIGKDFKELDRIDDSSNDVEKLLKVQLELIKAIMKKK